MKQSTRQVKTVLADTVILALFAALMFSSQVAMASLPNIEIVTLFIILCTEIYGLRSLYSIYVFVLAEGLFYGFGIWWVSYLYVWSILALVVLLIRKNGGVIIYTITAAGFGLMFGTLCSIPYFISGGIGAGIAYIAAGVGFDITHAIGNAVSVAALYYPLSLALKKVIPYSTQNPRRR